MRCVLVATLGKTQILMHPLLLVVLAGACVLGRLYALLQAILALLMHEAAHAAAAIAFGCRLRSVEFYPFGGVMRLGGRHISADAEWCIAAAGPVMSFIAAGVAALACYVSPRAGARVEPFLTFNLTLAAVNLLPALPLDGGRIVRFALAKKLNPSFAQRLTAWTGVALGAVMLVLSGVAAHYGIYNLTLPVMGVFLLLASAYELRTVPEKQLAALWQKEDAIQNGGMEVHMIAANASMRGEEALRLMRGNRYNCIRVVDEHMRLLGELDEAALLIGMVQRGSGAPIGEILRCNSVQKHS